MADNYPQTTIPQPTDNIELLLAKIAKALGGSSSGVSGGAASGSDGLSSLFAQTIPATNGAAVTPSDSTALVSRAVWVGGAGNLAVRFSGAPTTTVTISGVPAGTLLPISVVRIMAATTATNIAVLS